MNSNIINGNIINSSSNSNAAPHKAVSSSGVNNPNARPSVSRVSNLRGIGLMRRAAALCAFASLFALSHPAGRAQGVAAGKPGSSPASGAPALTQGKRGTSPIGRSPSTPSISPMKNSRRIRGRLRRASPSEIGWTRSIAPTDLSLCLAHRGLAR